MKKIGQFTDRMLGMLVPRASAAAACAPSNECAPAPGGLCRCFQTYTSGGQCRTRVYFVVCL